MYHELFIRVWIPVLQAYMLVICSPLSPCFIVRCMDTKALVLVRKHELTPRSVALREPLAIHQDASQNALHWHQIN